MKEAYFVFSPELLSYKFSDEHPFNHIRVQLTYDLLKKANLLTDDHIVTPRMATDEEISFIHDPAYIQTVKLAGSASLLPETLENFGLGTDDTPIFENMHEATARVVGATLTACELVMEKKAKHALNLSGGLHHGLRGKASGFCIYNDCSIAIEYLRRNYDARILYVDTDAHHGDGVQWAFYDDPNVCTFSIHETGRYLFPGTGHVNERGHGKGYGFSFNLPVDAFTEDDSWKAIYAEAMEKIIAFFKPDVIITQNGADSHYFDPLTHLTLTMDAYRYIPKVAHELAHTYCNGRWIAVGGGGYDHYRVVPRAWGLIWCEMNRASFEKCSGPLPKEWIDAWQPQTTIPLPKYWEDPVPLYPDIPRKAEITEKNLRTLQKALQSIHM